MASGLTGYLSRLFKESAENLVNPKLKKLDGKYESTRI